MDFKILATMTYYMHMHPCKTSYKYVSRNCVKSKLYFCRKLQIFVEESFFLNSIERNLISKYKRRLFLNIMRTPPCASPFTWESFTLQVKGLLPSRLYIREIAHCRIGFSEITRPNCAKAATLENLGSSVIRLLNFRRNHKEKPLIRSLH